MGHALGELHGPVGVYQTEGADDPGVAGKFLVEAVGAIFWVDAVAVYAEDALVAEGEVVGVGVDANLEVVAEESAGPEVVVSADEVELDSGAL